MLRHGTGAVAHSSSNRRRFRLLPAIPDGSNCYSHSQELEERRAYHRKGQVTIPIDIRREARLLPHTEVEFQLDRGGVRIVKAKPRKRESRGQAIARRLRGTGTIGMTTDQIMALMHGER